MLLTSSVMIKIIFTQEYQKIPHLLLLTLLLLQKTFLEFQMQKLILLPQMQLNRNILLNVQHVVHK